MDMSWRAIEGRERMEKLGEQARRIAKWHLACCPTGAAIKQAGQRIAELEAENERLREGHKMKDSDNAHYEDGWRQQVGELFVEVDALRGWIFHDRGINAPTVSGRDIVAGKALRERHGFATANLAGGE